MRFALRVALRHLRSGRSQTVLTVAAVAIAVTVIIFITSLISGLQRRLLKDFIGSQPHVTVKAREKEPQLLSDAAPNLAASHITAITTRQKQALQRQDIDQALLLREQLTAFPGIVAIAPSVRGQAFVIRGARRFGVTVSGAIPSEIEPVVNLRENMVSGRWLDIGPEDVVIGYKLANDAGIKLGDKVGIQSQEGITRTMTIAGIFQTGQNVTDLGSIFVTLRTGQNLLKTSRNVSSIQLKLSDPFAANDVADRIADSLHYKTESWMREQAQFMNGLRAQNSSSLMISAFALLASAFSIASVLIVSILRKSKEIGILKSMGTRDSVIMAIFALEGLGVAVIGAILGCGLGAIMLQALSGIKQVVRMGKTDQLFPIIFDPLIFLTAAGAAIGATLVAALLPARQAARMNPVDIIHGN